MSCPENDVIKAVVTGFSSDKNIVFCHNIDYGTVTFHAGKLGVWRGGNSPQKDQVVMLSEITMFKQGWRSENARPYELNDEEHEMAAGAWRTVSK